MTVAERKGYYKVFEQETKKKWKYNVQKSIFNKSITKKGTFFNYATKGLKDSGNFDDGIISNSQEMFKYFVAHLLNDNKETRFKWWVVNSKYVNNVFLDEENKKFIIFMNRFNDTNKELMKTKELAEKIYKAFAKLDREKLVEFGLWKGLVAYIFGTFRSNFYSEEKEREIKDVYKKQIVWMTNNDFHGNLDNDEQGEYETWGLPSLFSKIKFKEFKNHSDNNVFTVKSEFNNNQMKYIDVVGSSRNRKNGRVVVVPIQISELISFIKQVQEEHGTIDSLFSLNVRDRKKNKNKVSDSILNKPEHFLMLNNGITAIVDEINIDTLNNEPNISFQNIKIINGQQTTNTLFKYYTKNCDGGMPPAYFKSWILMKAYMIDKNSSTEERNSIYNSISNASNSQNAIKAKDLLSTRAFNQILQEKLLKIGINYSYRDGVSDFSMQLSRLPKITLNELVKMHYIFLSGEAWKRGSIGRVFDSIIGLKKPRDNSSEYKYAKSFNSQSPNELSEQLLNISTLQLFYRNKKKELGNEKQGLDLLIYLALVLQKHGKNGYSIDIEKFVKLIKHWKTPGVDSNNYYKSAKYIPFILEKLFIEYGLEGTEEYLRNKEFFK